MADADAMEFDVSDEGEVEEGEVDKDEEILEERKNERENDKVVDSGGFKGEHFEIKKSPMPEDYKRLLLDSGDAKVVRRVVADNEVLIFTDKERSSDDDYTRMKFGITSPNPYEKEGKEYHLWIDRKVLYRNSPFWFLNWFPSFDHAGPPKGKWRYDLAFKSITLHNQYGKEKSLGDVMELVAEEKLDPECFYRFELSIKIRVTAWTNDGLGNGTAYTSLDWNINGCFWSMIQYFIHPMFTRFMGKKYTNSSFKDLFIRVSDSSSHNDGESRVRIEKDTWQNRVQGLTLRSMMERHKELFRDRQGVLDIEFLFSLQEHRGA